MAWRAANPPLSDDQIILKNLTNLQEAAQRRQTKNVASFLARDFTWGSMTRKEFVSMMSGALFNARDVQILLSNVDLTRPDADNAETAGNYSVSMRQGRGAPLTNDRGQFKLYWRKEEGEWKVYKAEGGTNLAN